MKRVLVTMLAVVVAAGCGGDKGGTTTTPPPAAVATVEISQSTASIKVGELVSLSAVAKSGSGEVLTGRTQTWTSSQPNVASVNQGAVSGLAPGVSTITVTIEQKTATAAVTVELPGVASVQVDAPRRGFVRVGGTSQLTVVLRDASGTTQTGRPVAWSSSDQAKATVDGNGLVTGVSPGTAIITATSDGKSGSVTVTATSLPEPSIAAVSPATLTPGATATITGANFSATASEDEVTVAGVRAPVTSASPTQLTVTLPANMPCLTTGSYPVAVVTGGGPAELQHPLQVANQRALTVGQSLVLTDSTQVSCNELSVTGGQYIVSVYTKSPDLSSRTDFELRGNGTGGASLLRVPLPAYSAVASLPPQLAELMRLRAEGARIHRAMMAQDRQLFRRLSKRVATVRGRFAPSRSLSGVGTTTAGSHAPVPQTEGAMTTLRVRKSTDQACSSYDSVRARVVRVGTKSIVLEDSAAPLARTMDADLQEMGQAFDTDMFPILTANFGNPLAYDASTDGNQKILMLFTSRVNDRAAGLLGFVTVCDFLPAATYAASNQAEIFYARVPTSTGTNRFNFNHLVGWKGFMKGTVIHEAKHIVSFGERMATPIDTDLEEAWLEEGMAQVATELYARQVYGTSWKANTPYSASVSRDIFAPGAQFLMADHFIEVYDYLSDLPTLSYLTTEDVTVYGSAWMFARWLTDQYATNEASFLSAMTQEYSRYGLDNIENKAGRPYAELQGNFALTLAADDFTGLTPAPGARYTLPSWNTPSMFAGFANDLQGFTAVPLAMRTVDFGNFAESVSSLRSGSASYFLIRGTQTKPQLLDLRGSGGLALPSTSPLRLAILRVQ